MYQIQFGDTPLPTVTPITLAYSAPCPLPCPAMAIASGRVASLGREVGADLVMSGKRNGMKYHHYPYSAPLMLKFSSKVW